LPRSLFRSGFFEGDQTGSKVILAPKVITKMIIGMITFEGGGRG